MFQNSCACYLLSSHDHRHQSIHKPKKEEQALSMNGAYDCTHVSILVLFSCFLSTQQSSRLDVINNNTTSMYFMYCTQNLLCVSFSFHFPHNRLTDIQEQTIDVEQNPFLLTIQIYYNILTTRTHNHDITYADTYQFRFTLTTECKFSLPIPLS